ncbi:MAG: POT family MFS transporter [Puniceicoccales bacterium]|nr:POT family MFS transporter [Puniceicoccales bacterium]
MSKFSTGSVEPVPAVSGDVSGGGGRFPPQIKYILGNEACERFSFYGMKGILALYIIGVLHKSSDASTEIVHLFGAVVYCTPLLGAWLSDQILGRYKTILWVSFLYCAGHGTLALSDLSASLAFKEGCLFVGLAFIAVGAGGIKPCVSAFMGDQFGENQGRAVARAYAAFYWCINIGSLGAFLIIPWVKDEYGYGWAFAIPGILMAVATAVFWLGRSRYKHVPPARADKSRVGFFRVLIFAYTNRERREGETRWDAARRKFRRQDVDDAVGTLRVLWVFLLIPPFFALFDQTSSTWLLQGNQMEAFQIWGHTFSAEQMQAANPAMVLFLIPLLTFGVYPFLGKFASPLRRMAVGMFIAAVSFGIVGWLQMRIEGGEKISLLWQVLPYLVLTVSEILVSTTGLEFAYTQAPKNMKSIITSFWLLTMTAGNLLVAGITRFMPAAVEAGSASASSGRFFLYAKLMVATAVLFALATSFYKYRERTEAEAKS